AAVRALAARVQVRHDAALDALYPAKWPHRIVVVLENGERVLLESSAPPAADRDQVRAKFRTLATPVVGAASADAIMAAVDDLERLADLSPLLRPLRLDWAAAA